MSGSINWKALSVGALLVLFSFFTAANFVPKDQRVESEFWPDNGLRLGLDLRGGIHWVVGVELDDAIERELEFVRKNVEDQLEEDEIALTSSTVENQTLRFVLSERLMALSDDGIACGTSEPDVQCPFFPNAATNPMTTLRNQTETPSRAMLRPTASASMLVATESVTSIHPRVGSAIGRSSFPLHASRSILPPPIKRVVPSRRQRRPCNRDADCPGFSFPD